MNDLESSATPATDTNGAATALPESPPAAPLLAPAPVQRSRNGKVARLPKAVRDRINHMLDDGLTFARIIRALGSDSNGLTPAHIGTWKTGGYNDYLREQQRLELCRLNHDFLASFVGQCQGTESYQAAPKIAAALLCEIFVDLGPETIRRALQQSPMNAFRLLNALARILSGGLRCERFLAQKAELEAASTAPGTPQVKGLTPKTFKQINEELHLM
jgi:hypothetical protein